MYLTYAEKKCVYLKHNIGEQQLLLTSAGLHKLLALVYFEQNFGR